MSERYDYVKGRLEDAVLAPSPTDQLARWLDDAITAGTVEPAAMCLSTVGPDGRPSARFVLMRGLDEGGLVFYTNYESRKGRELEANPFACVTFWWSKMERQVRVEGRVERVDSGQSDAYFHSRPRESQIASAASPQSRPVASREALEAMVRDLEERYPEGDVPRPEHWGGFRLVPDRVEFWQGRAARLHDRFMYRRSGADWIVERLAP